MRTLTLFAEWPLCRTNSIACSTRLWSAPVRNSNLTTWAPAVDINETEHELVVKADLPGVDSKDLDIRVENNILTIRGERKFEKKVDEADYLRVERAYGSSAAASRWRTP